MASQNPLVSTGERQDSKTIIAFVNRFVVGKKSQIDLKDGGIVEG